MRIKKIIILCGITTTTLASSALLVVYSSIIHSENDTKIKKIILEANQKLDALKLSDIQKPTLKNLVYDDATPQKEDINHPIHLDFIFKFKSATTFKGDKSSIVYEVKYNLDIEGLKSKDLIFEVERYQIKQKLKISDIIPPSMKKIVPNSKFLMNKDLFHIPLKSGYKFKYLYHISYGLITKDIPIFKVDSSLLKDEDYPITNYIFIYYEAYWESKIFNRDFRFPKAFGFLIPDYETAKFNEKIIKKIIKNIKNKKYNLKYPIVKNKNTKNPTSNDFNPPELNKLKLTFESASVVNKKGESEVVYKLSINDMVRDKWNIKSLITNGAGKEYTFLVSGFKSNMDII